MGGLVYAFKDNLHVVTAIISAFFSNKGYITLLIWNNYKPIRAYISW